MYIAANAQRRNGMDVADDQVNCRLTILHPDHYHSATCHKRCSCSFLHPLGLAHLLRSPQPCTPHSQLNQQHSLIDLLLIHPIQPCHTRIDVAQPLSQPSPPQVQPPLQPPQPLPRGPSHWPWRSRGNDSSIVTSTAPSSNPAPPHPPYPHLPLPLSTRLSHCQQLVHPSLSPCPACGGQPRCSFSSLTSSLSTCC